MNEQRLAIHSAKTESLLEIEKAMADLTVRTETLRRLAMSKPRYRSQPSLFSRADQLREFEIEVEKKLGKPIATIRKMRKQLQGELRALERLDPLTARQQLGIISLEERHLREWNDWFSGFEGQGAVVRIAKALIEEVADLKGIKL